MAKFTLTNKGAELLARNLAGEGPLKFTNFKLGSGHFTGDVKTITDMVASFGEWPITGNSKQSDNLTVRLDSYVDNSTFNSQKELREKGVYCQLGDDTTTEILYSYVSQADYETLIPEKSTKWGKGFKVLAQVNDATNITVSVLTKKDKYDFNTVEEMKAASYIVQGDRIKIWDSEDHERIFSSSDDGSGIGFNNGFANLIQKNKVNIKWFQAKGDGATDDTQALNKALSINPSIIFFPKGDYHFKSNFILPQNVSLVGENGAGIGAQFSGNLPPTTFTFEGQNTGWAFTINHLNGNEGGGEITGIFMRAIGVSEDTLSGVLCNAKTTNIYKNTFLNFSTGIKIDNTEMWVHNNNILSCGICLDVSGTESHIYQNHGYSENKAILLRGSGNIIQGNKFYGDGANCPIGIEIWGRGNTIIGNVLDAFIDVAIKFYNNQGANDPSFNSVIGNNISGTGVSGQPNKTSVLFDASAGNITNNIISGNTFFNKRLDRETEHCIKFDAVGSFFNKNNQITNNSIEDLTFKNRTIISNGSNNVNNKVQSNGEYITENSGVSFVKNGDVIQHGLSRSPSFISITPTTSNVYFGYDSVTDSEFRILLRDSSGNLITSPININWKAESNYA